MSNLEDQQPFSVNRESLPDNASRLAHTKTPVQALVLNCMDYRLVDEVSRYLDNRGLRNQYDQLTMAGAAIGVLSEDHSAWERTFWEHVALARSLHGIRKIIVIDHRDCGACKAFVDIDCAADRDRETKIHRQWLTQLAAKIALREPTQEVELLLMDLDGSVEEITCPSK